VDILMSENRRPAEATQSLGILSLVHARGRHGDLGFQVGRNRVRPPVLRRDLRPGVKGNLTWTS